MLTPSTSSPASTVKAFWKASFEAEVTDFIRSCHPVVLEAMAERLAAAVKRGALSKWTEKRWANLWLSVPRSPDYSKTTQAWDAVFPIASCFRDCRRGSVEANLPRNAKGPSDQGIRRPSRRESDR